MSPEERKAHLEERARKEAEARAAAEAKARAEETKSEPVRVRVFSQRFCFSLMFLRPKVSAHTG